MAKDIIKANTYKMLCDQAQRRLKYARMLDSGFNSNRYIFLIGKDDCDVLTSNAGLTKTGPVPTEKLLYGIRVKVDIERNYGLSLYKEV